MLRITLRHYSSAMKTSFGTDINQMISCQHNILIMFHHQYTVTDITKISQCIDQAVIIPLVQTNRWFIQYISDTLQLRTDLCCQSYPL